MAIDRNPDSETYNPNKIAADIPRPAGLTKDDLATIPQFSANKKYEDKQYAQNNFTENQGPKPAQEARANDAPNADNPTTASAEASQRLPDAVNSKDPNGQSQMLANMMKSLLTVAMLISMASGSSSKRPTISTPTGKTMTNAFSAALQILSKRYTAEKVLTAFDKGFGVYGLNRIHDEYRDMVHAALSNLVSSIIIYGEKNIPTLIIPTFTYGTNIPTPLYTFPPEMYIKQYDPQIEKDFPGYILWLGPNGERIFTMRTAEQPPYENADQEVLTTAAYQIADALDSYVKNGSVLPDVVNTVLDTQKTSIQNNGMNLVVGYNSSNNLMNNLTLILGLLGTLTTLAQQMQLPKSVVDAGKIGIALTAFSRNMAMIKQMKGASSGAFTGITAVAGLGALTSLVGGFMGNGVPSPVGGGIGSLFNNNSSLSSTVSTAIGAAVTVAGVATAMRYSRASAPAVSAAANLVKNLGIAK